MPESAGMHPRWGLSDFSHYCDQTPEKKQLRTVVLIFVLQSLKTSIHHDRTARCQEGGFWLLCVSSQEAESRQNAGPGYKAWRLVPSDPLPPVRFLFLQ